MWAPYKNDGWGARKEEILDIFYLFILVLVFIYSVSIGLGLGEAQGVWKLHPSNFVTKKLFFNCQSWL